LGNPKYIGEKISIMKIIGRRELVPSANQTIVKAYNKMYALVIGYGSNGILVA
jgi:hypothetical protein